MNEARDNLALRHHIGWSGVVGSVLLTAYFVVPAVLGWPYAGGSGEVIAAFATSHASLFYAGAWLQVTGTMLSIVLLLGLVHLSRSTAGLADTVTVVAIGVLLATVVVEAAFLVAVPMAADAGDGATARAMFTLSNGVFVRIFALAPASATLVGLGLVIRRSGVLGRGMALGALALGGAFELAGLVAIVSPAGVIAATALSVGQGVWVLAAALTLVTERSDGSSTS